MTNNYTPVPTVTTTPIPPAVKVPSGSKPGTLLQIQVEGKIMQVQVPSGGVSEFYVSLPNDISQVATVPAHPVSTKVQQAQSTTSNVNHGHGCGSHRDEYSHGYGYHGHGHGYGHGGFFH